MSAEGKHILVKFLNRWRLLLGFEILLYAIGSSILVYFLSHTLLLSLLSFIIIAIAALIFIKPWKPNLKSTSSYLDAQLDIVEYSTGLLLLPQENLSNVAKLQQLKISRQLNPAIKSIKTPGHLLRSGIISTGLILIGFLISQSNILNFNEPQPAEVTSNPINFHSEDSTALKTEPPKLTEQLVTINYPEYTNIPSHRSSKMDIKAVEGSKIGWEIQFDSEINSATMESMGSNYPMTLRNGSYTKHKELSNSGIYNFKFEDLQGKSHSSDLYAIEVVKDANPVIEIKGLKQFSSFEYNETKIVQFTTHISDDYGIANAHIIATLSKGAGESVRFREEKLNFENQVTSKSKTLTLTKKIDLDKMDLEPGDELYFYVETSDYKTPKSNISRSETYFAAIKDTVSYVFGVEGTLGVDRMPDYFRSQRQLIIDTEKLISKRPNLLKKEFNFESNELGYDQKALRNKYGEFMGEESEMGIDNQDITVEDSADPLAEYTHDHDSDNEHNLVDKKSTEKEDASKNPLQEFVHDHEDPEMATLFAESLKTKLLKALNEMWDAELYLRLYEPEKSLPYQYKALKLIQDIKNSARIYVHRIGFDPPPIKKDKRLTGKLDEVSSYRKSEDIQQKDIFPFMRQSILKLEELIITKTNISEKDITLFEQAGNELAVKAIEFPGKHLKTLQQLKWIIEGKENTIQILQEVQQGLLLAIPETNTNPVKSKLFSDKINQLLLKELEIHDR